MKELKYKRLLIKFSGEALKGERQFGVDPSATTTIATQIKHLAALDLQIALVIGGGNIFRGLSASRKGMDRVTADNMGMLATVMNALALQDALEALNVPTRVQTAIEMREIAEPYIRRRAIRHLELGRVVVFAAGTGSPYFTTDSTAALRATEINAEVILKATKVDGIYTADPEIDKKAQRYDTIKFQEALEKRLQVMDSTAFSMCMDNSIPIIVFNYNNPNSLFDIVQGNTNGTTVVTN